MEFHRNMGLFVILAVIAEIILVVPTYATLGIATPTSTTQIIDVGHGALITSNGALAGTAPYTYQWLEETPGSTNFTPAGTTMSPSLSPFLLATSPSTKLGTYKFKLEVTDSESPPVTVVSNYINVTVNPPLMIGQISSTLYNITQDQVPLLTGIGGIGGTPPYTYQWLEETPGSANFTPIGPEMQNTLGVAYYFFHTSNSSKLGTYHFELKGQDSASSPSSAYSAVLSILLGTYNPSVVLTTATTTVYTTTSIPSNINSTSKPQTTISQSTIPQIPSKSSNSVYTILLAVVVIGIIVIIGAYYITRRRSTKTKF